MPATDSRVRSGVLKFTGAAGGATAVDFSCQPTSVAIVPSVNEEDPVEVLCGDKIGGGSTISDTLDFTVISDHASTTGLIAFSWENRGAIVDFEWQPDSNVAGVWTGTVICQALQVGGAVGEQLSIDGSWSIVTVTPPSGYGDGGFFTP